MLCLAFLFFGVDRVKNDLVIMYTIRATYSAVIAFRRVAGATADTGTVRGIGSYMSIVDYYAVVFTADAADVSAGNLLHFILGQLCEFLITSFDFLFQCIKFFFGFHGFFSF